MFDNIARIIDKYIPVKIEITDIIEIIILAIAFYDIAEITSVASLPIPPTTFGVFFVL